jgi:gliding motility-associated-like protein
MKKLLITSAILSTTLFSSCEKNGSDAELPESCKNIVTQSEITFPTAFTPNGDGKNDLSRAMGQDKDQWTNFEFTIYKLNGEIAFQSTDPNTSWDGRVNGTLSADPLYRVTIKFTHGAQNYDLCTYLYLLQNNGPCINLNGVDYNLLKFEDQYEPASGMFIFATAENFC